MKIDRLTVHSFLGAVQIDVATPRRVQLFAGRNGSGKSSVRDAVALALSADLGRVHLKKDAPQLINDASDATSALCEVVTDDGDTYSVSITNSGKIADSQKGRDTDPSLGYVLDAQRFAQLDATGRRGFLFGLMKVATDAVAVRQRLVARGCDGSRIDRVLPLMRSGFPAAHEEAKTKATGAKAAWRAVTGETFGSEKAKVWRATVPAYDKSAGAALATELQHADVALEQWQREIGGLQAQQQHRQALQAKLPALQDHAGRIERISAKLATDEQQLADWEADLAKTLAAAGAAPRVGLVHQLAAAIARALPAWPNQEQIDAGWQGLRDALTAYETEHGPALVAAGGDDKARDRLPSIQQSRDLLARAVENDRRDLAAAQRAQAEAAAITAELAEPFDAAALTAAQEQVATLKAGRAELVKKLDLQKSLKAQAEAADKKTAEAAAHAADVAAWDAIATALAPDGIPAELLTEALGPINDRLAQSAADAQWPAVVITPDMAVTVGGRAYALLSESEQWRADAMLAEAIAFQSGWRLLVLDRFDVLDLPGRSDLIAWLDTLADTGEIDTCLLFGTLKALPASLPTTFDAHWLNAGTVEQLKEAA